MGRSTMDTLLDTLFIFGAQYLYLVALAVAGVFFLRLPRHRRKKLILYACVALPLAYLLALVARYLYYDPRPFVTGNFTPLIPHSPDNGFPSDHVLLVSALAATLYPFNKRESFVIWGFAILVAISRVYVGVHHPADVIASMIISIIAAGLVYGMMSKGMKRDQSSSDKS